METLTVLTIPALVYALIQFAKHVTARDTNAVVTQLCAWGSGVGAVVLFAQSDWADQINVGALALSRLNGFSLVLVGLGVASAATAGYDVKSALDSSDSAKSPPLVPTKGA